jgi:hypothetical protein
VHFIEIPAETTDFGENSMACLLLRARLLPTFAFEFLPQSTVAYLYTLLIRHEQQRTVRRIVGGPDGYAWRCPQVHCDSSRCLCSQRFVSDSRACARD